MAGTMTADEMSDLIGLVYDSALEKSQWRMLTNRLRALCPGHVVAVTTFDDGDWRTSHQPTLPEGTHGDEIEDLMEAAKSGDLDQPKDLHETMFDRQPLTLGAVYSTRQLFAEEEFRNFAAYQKTMAPIGAGHYAGIHISIIGQRRAAIMVVENDRDPTAKDHEHICALLSLIAPHAIRATQFARALGMARDAAQTYEGFIDAIAVPLLVVSSDGKLQFANALGQKVLDAGHLIAQRPSGGIELARDPFRRTLDAALAESIEKKGPVAFRLEGDGEDNLLCICPFRPSLSEASGVDRILMSGQPLFALFLGSQATGAVSLQLLKDAFTLTHREAEICSQVLSGGNPTSIAHDTGRSEKTVRNQIQAVYEKVGVTSNRELTDALAMFRVVGSLHQRG